MLNPGISYPNRVDAGDHGSEEERPVAAGFGRTNPTLGGFSQRDCGSANHALGCIQDRAPQCADSEGRLRSNEIAAKQQQRQFRERLTVAVSLSKIQRSSLRYAV